MTTSTKRPHCYTQRRSYVSHGNFRPYTDLVSNLIQYLDTIGYISYLRLIHLGQITRDAKRTLLTSASSTCCRATVVVLVVCVCWCIKAVTLNLSEAQCCCTIEK